MQSMYDLALGAIEDMPPVSRFRESDGAVIIRHQQSLLALEAEVVQGFYDTLYAHGPTAEVFVDGERRDREVTLSHWWRRTVTGPLDHEYFAWMALVGLVHVVREVSNPMMLAMADYVVGFVAAKADESDLPAGDAEALVEAFRRLASTVGAIITHGYDQAVASALFNVVGMPEALLRRLRDQEVVAALADARAEL